MAIRHDGHSSCLPCAFHTYLPANKGEVEDRKYRLGGQGFSLVAQQPTLVAAHWCCPLF